MQRFTTAGIAIRNGKVLVAKRESGGYIAGKWEFPGGKNRYGETLEETLRREYAEEFSVDIKVLKEVFAYDFENNGTLYHLHAFLIELLSEDIILSVHTNVLWAEREALIALDMAPSDSAIRDFILSELLLPD